MVQIKCGDCSLLSDEGLRGRDLVPRATPGIEHDFAPVPRSAPEASRDPVTLRLTEVTKHRASNRSPAAMNG